MRTKTGLLVLLFVVALVLTATDPAVALEAGHGCGETYDWLCW